VGLEAEGVDRELLVQEDQLHHLDKETQEETVRHRTQIMVVAAVAVQKIRLQLALEVMEQVQQEETAALVIPLQFLEAR